MPLQVTHLHIFSMLFMLSAFCGLCSPLLLFTLSEISDLCRCLHSHRCLHFSVTLQASFTFLPLAVLHASSSFLQSVCYAVLRGFLVVLISSTAHYYYPTSDRGMICCFLWACVLVAHKIKTSLLQL